MVIWAHLLSFNLRFSGGDVLGLNWLVMSKHSSGSMTFLCPSGNGVRMDAR